MTSLVDNYAELTTLSESLMGLQERSSP
jgi:hypothetical protein